MKIAVIGSGIAGLAATWYLSKAHEVTLFERAPKIGMDAHSVEVDCGQGTVHLNAPMRVFFEDYYPSLTQLYREIDVGFEAIEYSGSFSRQGESAYFRYKNYSFGSTVLPFLTGRSAFHLRALKLGAELVRFLRLAKGYKEFSTNETESLTVEQYIEQNGFSRDFAESYLYPAFAGICTCSYASVKAYPASIILAYLDSGLTWSRVNRLSQGTHEVTKRLAAVASEVRCNTYLKAVNRFTHGVSLTDDDGHTEDYDHVVIATQANQALELLAHASAEERTALAKFQYETSRTIVHTDRSLAPANVVDWAPVNFLMSDFSDKPMASIWMNQIYSGLGTDTDYFETWNPFHEADADKVLIDASVQRPVVTSDSLQGIRQIDKLHEQHDRRIWFCGSYASRGIPLLESAVVSAKTLSEKLCDRNVGS